MLISILSREDNHTIELKSWKKYAKINGKGSWLLLLVKCLIKYYVRPSYHVKTELDKY